MTRSSITTMARAKSAIPGVTIYAMSDNLKRGKPQLVLVEVEPNGKIPLHTHEVDAKMMVVAGSGKVLSEDPEANGKEVAPGSIVFFERAKPHGFTAGANGLTFTSENGGIVDDDGWDIEMSA